MVRRAGLCDQIRSPPSDTSSRSRSHAGTVHPGERVPRPAASNDGARRLVKRSVSTLLYDVRAAWRYAVRKRAVTALAIGMLALGIGATTAMFSVLDAVVLRTLPYRNPAELVTVWQTFPHWRGTPVLDALWNRIALSFTEYRAVSALSDDFAGTAAAYWRPGARLTGIGDPVDVSVARGSASLLPLLGLQTALGRWFLPGEEGPAAPQLAVLPHALWVERLGADPHVLGRTIDLDGQPFVVVGVLPAAFPFASLSPFTTPADRAAISTPIGSWPGDLTEHSQNFEVVARLRPGISHEHARLDAGRAIRADRSPAQHDATVSARQDAEVGDLSTPLIALLSAAVALLLITCGNLAALLLGEGTAREGEIRTRLALGAGPARIVRQLVAESALVALAGGVIGTILAAVLSRGLIGLAPVALPHANQIAMNPRVLAVSLLTACLAALAVGLAPALSLTRRAERAQGGSRSVTRRRSASAHALLVGQVALSVVLLLASGLLDRTLAVEQHTPPGFETAHLLTITLNASGRGRATDGPGGPQGFFDAVITQLGAIPGVTRVTATSNLPIAGSGGQWAISPDPSVKLSSTSPSAQHDEVLPGYLETMGIRVLAGRTLTEGDRQNTPLVAIVNETMARKFWPTSSAIGKQFLAPNGGVRTIVGIVADTRERGLSRPSVPTVYQSVRQLPTSRQTLVIVTPGDPTRLAAPARRAIWSVDPALPMGPVSTMDQVLYDSLAPERYRAALVSFFALVAALMTAIGIAGVAMRAMAGQLRELCIRMAVGATPARMVRLIVGRYVRLSAAGMAVGVAVSFAALRLVRTYLVGVTTRDPATFSGVALFVLTMVIVAAWLPTRRLHRTNLTRELARP